MHRIGGMSQLYLIYVFFAMELYFGIVLEGVTVQ